MPGLYDIAKAVYSGDVHAAREVLERMRRESWDVTRARLASQGAEAPGAPVDLDVQVRLDALMASAEREIFKRPSGRTYRRP